MRRNLLRRLLSLIALLAVCLTLGGLALAQEETAATITGQVTDATGALIPNATVTITNKDTNAKRTIQTNGDGAYTVTPLSPGAYTVLVEQAGFKRYIQNLTLNARDRRPVDIVLETGGANETVTVTGDASPIQDSPTVQGLVSGTQVRQLPLVNRDFLKLLETGIAGVSSDLADETQLGLSNRTSFSINGLRRNGINFLVDGVNNVDGGSNITLLSTPSVDSIQEFKVLTSNFTAEFGRSAGAISESLFRPSAANQAIARATPADADSDPAQSRQTPPRRASCCA